MCMCMSFWVCLLVIVINFIGWIHVCLIAKSQAWTLSPAKVWRHISKSISILYEFIFFSDTHKGRSISDKVFCLDHSKIVFPPSQEIRFNLMVTKLLKSGRIKMHRLFLLEKENGSPFVGCSGIISFES